MVKLTLDQVIRELMISSGDTTENKYARYLQCGINGLREFNFDISQGSTGSPTCAYLTVNDNQTVDLPNDYVNYIKIAVIDGNGQIHSLGLNESMAFNNAVDSCGNPIAAIPNTVTNTPSSAYFFLANTDGYADNFRNGEMTGRFFGIGGGTNPYGYYKVNTSTNQIQLGCTNTGTIFLEYLSDLTLVDGEYLVHPYSVAALKRFIRYEIIEMNDRISDATKERARIEKYNEMAKSKARFNSFNVTEWTAAFRSGNLAAPKF